MSFAFNFLPPDDASGEQQAIDGVLQDDTPSPVATQATDGEPSHDIISHPFSWKEHLDVLLDERAQQEIVFQDIELDPSKVEEEDDLDCDDEYEGDQKEETNIITPLRRVCMEQYRKEVTPGVYEGGLQVWECSLDLVRYFQQHSIHLGSSSSSPTGSNVNNGNAEREKPSAITTPTARTCLELGCGHGLPGCWLLREALQTYYGVSKNPDTAAANDSKLPNHAEDDPPFQVVFVDYNDYVIDDVTLSNIVINTAGIVDAKVLAQRHFVQVGSGDWKDMSRQMSYQDESATNTVNNRMDDNRRFDFIIAAETTYTPEASKDTAELLLKHLTIESGIGWIASKRYYFGVGGGTDALRQAAQQLSRSPAERHCLRIETAQVFDNGAGNIREILKVTCHVKDAVS